MKLLIDNALSPSVAEALRKAGYDATHVRDHGLQGAADEIVFDHAVAEDRHLVSADSDFAELLSARKTTSPSLILFRHGTEYEPEQQAARLLVELPDLAARLDGGALVVLEPGRRRVRTLPL